MRTHTTYTDLRRIMKLHTDGLSTDEISKYVCIDPLTVQSVIDTRTKKKPKKVKPKAVEKEPETTE